MSEKIKQLEDKKKQMYLTINTGDLKEFIECMRMQKRWILNEIDKRPQDVVARRNLLGLLSLLDEVGDCIVDQSDLPEEEVFDLDLDGR